MRPGPDLEILGRDIVQRLEQLTLLIARIVRVGVGRGLESLDESPHVLEVGRLSRFDDVAEEDYERDEWRVVCRPVSNLVDVVAQEVIEPRTN